jgi:hypothetical protein
MAAILDTLKIAKRLEAAGMEPRAAEVLAEVLHDRGRATDQRLATKADLNALRAELAFAQGRLETRVAEGKLELLKWGAIVPLLAAQLVVVFGIYLK